MQSNGSAIQTSDSKQAGNLTPSTKQKKTPPKPPKRVSFDLKYRQIGEKRSSPIESPNPFIQIVNGSLDENSNDKKLDAGVEQSTVNNLSKNCVETKGDIDKSSDKTVSPAKVNTDICDTGQPKADNEIRNKTVDKVDASGKNEPSKQSRSDRLRLEFVKANETPVNANPFSWANRNSEARSSIDSNSSLKSPSPDLQSRLSESQSKIAKLQQNLPKLSDATVDALKNKYSPASFGYPKSFIKSPTETSRIPSLASRSPTVKVEKEETKETVSQEVKTETTETESTVTVKRRHTFRTELFILPAGSETEEPKEDIKYNEETLDTKVPTVQTKFISSEIFPKDLESQPVKTEQISVKEECVPAQQKSTAEPVFIEDTSQSSDTLTESEDSQNIKYRTAINSDLDTTPSKLQDIENNNSTDIEDPDTSSFTSDITYCEVYEEELEAALQETEMEDPKKKPQKKRSNSFKRIFGFGSSKDKKKDDKKKSDEEKNKNSANGMKKKDNMLSENAQNEAHVFDRTTAQRHTISGHYNTRNWERKESEPYYSNSGERYQVPRQQEQYASSNYENSRMPVLQRHHSLQGTQGAQGHRIEDRLNKIQYDLLLAQQTNHQLNSNIPVNSPLHRNLDEYVCMDNNDKSNRTDLTQPGFVNAQFIDKYIDTTSSSSISTLESDTRNIIYENTVKTNRVPKVSNNLNTKIPVPNSSTPDKNVCDSSPSIGEKCYERPKFADSPEMFTTTPKRAQGPQLIKPKAIIPINTERALPNPYRTIRDPQQPKSPELRENVYGNLPTPENIKIGGSPTKETVYGKPVPVARRNELAYGNVSSNEANINTEEIYGTVYDSLVPVGAQLKITKAPIINGANNPEKRSRSVSPSQRHKAVSLPSSQSFNRKSRLPIQSSPTSPNSPTRKEVEATKLRLSANREKLEPRLKSPIEDRKNQPKKTPEPVKKENRNNIPSHLNLEIEIDYPDNNLNEILDRKETPEKSMFSSDNEPSSPKRGIGLKRQAHMSPNRPKSFTHSTPKSQQADAVRSALTFRSDSPASVTSSHSMSSLSSKSKPITSADVKDLKNTEVYYYEQTTNQNVQKEDVSPDQSPQQVLTQATIHQPKSPPRRVEPRPEQTVNNARRTPVDLHPEKAPTSPQKAQNMQNVEAYYWQQIKKEHELYNQHLQMIARQNSVQVPQEYFQRSRSLSSGSRQGQRRSTSLPRNVAPPNLNQRNSNDLYGYARTGRQDPIPEGRPVNQNRVTVPDYGVVGQNTKFVRGSPQRSTVGPISTQKRSQQGQDLIYENYYPGVELRHQAKSVQPGAGYAPIFKRGSLVPTNHPQDSPPQVNKKVSFSSAQSDEAQIWPTKNGFTQSPPTRRVDKKTDSMDDEVFLPPSPQMVVNLSKEPVYIPNKLPQREPIYGRTATGKQVTVTNKVCDMYGQIHEATYGNLQKGVIYGQLQANPVPGSPASLRSQYLNRSDPSFVRGTRLTASFNDMRSDAPRRPLPPIPGSNSPLQKLYGRMNVPVSESESGSEAGEVQRILAQKERRRLEEEWNSDSKSGRGQSGGDSGIGGRGGDGDGEVRGGRGSRSGRRDDPRRHTLSGGADHYPAGMAVQGGPLSRTMDLEVPMPRGYPPPSSAMLFDDDPGIMSEVETSSTGFRRGGKQRSSLPVVRTPSKTLERPLGLVFLQYRNETKRALLPNEITSIDTVKALFVRSFPKQLTMEYLDSPLVKIYIHDSSKDMFYELEDLRSHLRDIRDRSVLRLFESADISGGLPGPGTGISGGVGHFEDQSYFSEPEFDSEYQHQHIHKSKTSGAKGAPPYYMGSTTLPRGGPLLRAYSPAIGGPIPADRLKSLPTGAPPPPKPLRTYSSGGAAAGGRFNTFHSQADLRLRSDNPLFSMPDRIHTDGYMSSPERGSRGTYEDPYYSQYAARSGSITPVIDEEASDTELLDESYSLYGVKLPPPGGPRAVPAPRTQFPSAPTAVPYDATRLRVENMERQLANLTGLVQKALHQNPTSTREFLQVPGGRDSYRTGDEFDKNSSSSSASLPDKSVSFEKSVSFSDEPPDMNSPKQHSPQHTADTKPPKPAIKSSTLPRTSSQERDRLKPAPPPKPASLSPAQYDNSRHIYRDLQLTPEMYNQLRGLQKKAKDLRTEVRNLRRLSQAQAHSVRETIKDTFIKIRAMLLASGEQVWQAGIDQEKLRLSREEDLYKQEMLRLEKDLTELEATVEELRGNVINRKTRVNMSDVENMALILSKSSKTVADLKLRFPGLQDAMKNLLSSEMEKVVREEKFLKEEPERLESALRRCKKLTGTLVTLKRLASVQEQRLPCANNASDGQLSPSLTETPPITPPSAQHSKPPAVPSTRSVLGQSLIGGEPGGSGACDGQRPENALDALLDELQTFSKPHSVSANPTPAPSTVTTQLPQAASYKVPGTGSGTPSMAEIGRKGSMDSATLLPVQNLTVSTATGSLRRLHSYPSGSDTDNSPPIQPLQRTDSRGAGSANKPPIPERNAELLQHLASGRRVPPPPPPRTSSKSPLASPTSPSLPPRSTPAQNPLQHIQNVQNMTDKPQSQFEAATQNLGLGTLRRNVPGRSSLKEKSQTLPRNIGSNLQVQTNTDGPENKLNPMSTSNSSSCESVNSQEGAKKGSRKEELEQRHQELLKKQKALQEQYARLQQLQRGNNTLTVVPPAPDLLLKKTGSESNLLQKMGLQMAAPQQMSGSLTHLANASLSAAQQASGAATATSAAGDKTPAMNANAANANTTTSKVYETDIL